MSDSLPNLFSPYRVKSLALPNRIVMAPMTRQASPNNIPGPDVAAYYRRRAEGGTALLVSECSFVDHPAANGFENAPAMYGEALEGWREVVDAVHAAGGRLFAQIWHAGPMRAVGMLPHPGVPGFGPMDVFNTHERITVGMTVADIEDIVQAFARAAGDARAVGFDGVEVHGAHGYLIDQFLWAKTNRRRDAFGGGIENRVRLAVQIVAAIRETVGEDYPIGFRFSQWKLGDFEARIAASPRELEKILLPLSEAGVDIFHPSTRLFRAPAFEGSSLSLAGWTKKITGKTTVAVGKIGIDTAFDVDQVLGSEDFATHPASVEAVEAALARGECDLVAVGRALLGDAHWTRKIRSGGLKDIRAFKRENLAVLD